MRSTSGGSCSPPAARNCGYARRMRVMAPRTSVKRSAAPSCSPRWWRIQATVACSAGESPHALPRVLHFLERLVVQRGRASARMTASFGTSASVPRSSGARRSTIGRTGALAARRRARATPAVRNTSSGSRRRRRGTGAAAAGVCQLIARPCGPVQPGRAGSRRAGNAAAAASNIAAASAKSPCL